MWQRLQTTHRRERRQTRIQQRLARGRWRLAVHARCLPMRDIGRQVHDETLSRASIGRQREAQRLVVRSLEDDLPDAQHVIRDGQLSSCSDGGVEHRYERGGVCTRRRGADVRSRQGCGADPIMRGRCECRLVALRCCMEEWCGRAGAALRSRGREPACAAGIGAQVRYAGAAMTGARRGAGGEGHALASKIVVVGVQDRFKIDSCHQDRFNTKIDSRPWTRPTALPH